jgi:hypothetical protein
MSKPLLLHALSVHDRMLEPNELPLYGRVWAYSKEECGREAFVSYCLSVMASLGMQSRKNIDLSLRQDVIAFDVESKGGTFTIVISLADDSLASDYFYFLGLWQRIGAGAKEKGSLNPPTHEDMLQPAFQYEVLFNDRRLATDWVSRWLQNEGYGVALYDGLVNMASNADFSGAAPARFVLSPNDDNKKPAKTTVRHALYSLRNLIALSRAAQQVYHTIWSDSTEARLFTQVGELAQASLAENIPSEAWDGMIRRGGNILFEISEVEGLRASQKSRIRGLNALFHSILAELHHRERPGMPPLWPRMLLPIELAGNLMGERSSMLKRAEKLASQVFRVINTRILALGRS